MNTYGNRYTTVGLIDIVLLFGFILSIIGLSLFFYIPIIGFFFGQLFEGLLHFLLSFRPFWIDSQHLLYLLRLMLFSRYNYIL